MKMNIGDFAKLSGVSVRTLRYYDEIGLLTPDYVDSGTGYRYYGEASFGKMQEILFYRELDFSLESIKKIISSPNYSKNEALRAQKKLLILKKERLERIIGAIESAEKGERVMDFKAFDSSTMDEYKAEVKARWGNTDAFKESEARGDSPERQRELECGMNEIIGEFAAAMMSGQEDTDALAEKLQNYITQTQYTCTDGILMCLGEMYVADERFRQNIDRHGEGTAQFIRDAVVSYCKNRQTTKKRNG